MKDENLMLLGLVALGLAGKALFAAPAPAPKPDIIDITPTAPTTYSIMPIQESLESVRSAGYASSVAVRDEYVFVWSTGSSRVTDEEDAAIISRGYRFQESTSDRRTVNRFLGTNFQSVEDMERQFGRSWLNVYVRV